MLLPLGQSVRIYLPYLMPAKQIVSSAYGQDKSFSLFFANRYLRNDATQWLDTIIKEKNPDFVGLAETDPEWIKKTILEKKYPFRVSVFDQSVWGLELFSKYPISQDAVTDLGPDVPKIINATVKVPNHESPLHIIVAHLPPPISNYRWSQALNMTRRLATEIRHSDEPWVVVGDFNSSPAGRVTRSFIHTARLHDAFWGFGFHPTWNQDIWFLQTIIDHAFYSDSVNALSSEIFPVEGSDHRGMSLQFMIDAGGLKKR